MRTAKYQPTLKEARASYWESVAKWDEVRHDTMSTWRQMGDAAHEVAAARRVWEDAAARAQDADLGMKERRRLAALAVNAFLPESLKNDR